LLKSARLSQTKSAQKRLYLSLDLGTVLENANDLIKALQVRHQHLRYYLRIEIGWQLSASLADSSRFRRTNASFS
jgi:hypothetical protein